MDERRCVLERSSYRTTTPVNEELERLVERRDRVIALLRGVRRPQAKAITGYRSRYAAQLWALAHAEWAETDTDAADR